MKNKLGLNEYKLLDIERKIVNTKLNLLDEYFTFNELKFDFEYIKQLHNFLFCEFYYEEDLGTRIIDEEEIKLINNYLNEINYICINKSNSDEVLNIIKKVWYLQPFIVGNTRTLIAYLKILDSAFLLNLNINVNIEIENNPTIFNTWKTVNQKRLTKVK